MEEKSNLQVRFPVSILNAIDQKAASHGTTTSDFIRAVIGFVLKIEKKEFDEIYSEIQQQQKINLKARKVLDDAMAEYHSMRESFKDVMTGVEIRKMAKKAAEEYVRHNPPGRMPAKTA